MRPHLALPILLASTLALAACGDAAGTAVPATTERPAAETESPTDPATGPATADPQPTVTTSPSPSATAPVTADDCSATGMTAGAGVAEQLPEPARATAELLLDAALRCDEQLLATAAAESDTSLTFGGADPYEFFGLPDDETGVHAVIVTLLTRTPYAAEADDATPATFVWPRVHTGDWADTDEAWQEVVDAGLLTTDEAADMRAAGSGYVGWRLGIAGDGTWRFLVAGD